MKNLHTLYFITLASISFLSVGCGGSGSAPSPTLYGAKAPAPYFFIQTNATPASEQWPNATITGWAVPNTMQCDVTQDTSCIADVGNASIYALTENGIGSFKTNAAGQADFGTDAIAAEWNFYATDNGSSQCSNGSASTTTLTGLSTGSQVLLTCGANDAEMVATPSSCVYINNEITGTITNTCPATITLAFPAAIASSHLLTLHAALTATDYNSSGTNLAQSSVTAATTASVVVPTPSTSGTNYLAVYNAAGSLVGVSEFTYTYSIITPPRNPCPTGAVATVHSGPTPDSVFCPPVN
jgi:hypothetical protein